MGKEGEGIGEGRRGLGREGGDWGGKEGIGEGRKGLGRRGKEKGREGGGGRLQPCQKRLDNFFNETDALNQCSKTVKTGWHEGTCFSKGL